MWSRDPLLSSLYFVAEELFANIIIFRNTSQIFYRLPNYPTKPCDQYCWNSRGTSRAWSLNTSFFHTFGIAKFDNFCRILCSLWMQYLHNDGAVFIFYLKIQGEGFIYLLLFFCGGFQGWSWTLDLCTSTSFTFFLSFIYHFCLCTLYFVWCSTIPSFRFFANFLFYSLLLVHFFVILLNWNICLCLFK